MGEHETLQAEDLEFDLSKTLAAGCDVDEEDASASKGERLKLLSQRFREEAADGAGCRRYVKPYQAFAPADKFEKNGGGFFGRFAFNGNSKASEPVRVSLFRLPPFQHNLQMSSRRR